MKICTNKIVIGKVINCFLLTFGFSTKNIHGIEISKNLNPAKKIGGNDNTAILRATKFNPHKTTMENAITTCFEFTINL